MTRKASFFDYIKAAFAWRWNMLAFGAGLVFGVLSGRADMLLPLVAAGEVAYLGLLSTHPKFRKSVDARFGQATNDPAKSLEQLQALLRTLPRNDQERFFDLKQRCGTMLQIAKQMRGEEFDLAQLDRMHTASLDRLLWMFLKLLQSKNTLDHFLKTVKHKELLDEIEETNRDLERARSEQRDALIRSYEDKLQTMQQRLSNFNASRQNQELIIAELDRIEQKVTAISEMTLRQQDPMAIGAQVDGIAESVSVTADAIRNLDVMSDIDTDVAPRLLSSEDA